jgi:hypothetical protein
MHQSRDVLPSFLNVFMETLFPRDRAGKVLIFLVLLSSLTYWLFSFWQHPHEPLSVAALYHGTDEMIYYPFVKALADGTVG